MVDHTQKALDSFSPKEILIVEKLYDHICTSTFETLDIKKLKGHSAVFRVRKGKIRVIFVKQKDGNVVIDVSRRNDKTYMAY